MLAMEPAECLEQPLNLVIKKDDTEENGSTGRTMVIGERIESEASIIIDEEEEKDAATVEEECAIDDNMAMLQDAVKSAESGGGLPTADHKLLTALYMSSLMQMSSLSAPRGVAPSPYGASQQQQQQQQQQSFVQLLAMVEARHRMWQQMNWPLPQGFLRNPLTMPPSAPPPSPYFDGATTTTTPPTATPTPTPAPRLTEQQLSQNAAPTYPLSCAKPEPLNPESATKQSFFGKRYTKRARAPPASY
jgi:transcription factor 7-like 2